MGACISSSSSSSADYSSRHRNKPSAYVVSVNGELRQYPLPVTVSRVLQSETSATSSFFLCNSDCLYFDDYIPSLNAQEELEAAQIYFLLPISKLNYRLAASDMAALAVKASVALQQINANSNNGLRRNRKAQISPLLLVHSSSDHDDDQVIDQQMKKNTSSAAAAVNYYYNYRNISITRSSSSGLGVSRSSSVRKLTRYSSRRRAKLAVRSFRIKLNTIYEGSQLIF